MMGQQPLTAREYGNARFSHGHECGNSFPDGKVVHDVSSHLGSSEIETEKFSIVALRQGEPNSQRVRYRRVSSLLLCQIREGRVEFCPQMWSARTARLMK